MAFLTAMLVTTALLTPVYWLAGHGQKPAESRISLHFNGLGRSRRPF